MKSKSVTAAARQIAVLTGLSRILGFVRDILFAVFLGAGPIADAFLVALKLPNMFRRMSAEGALTNAFLPQFAQAEAKGGKQAGLLLAAEVQIFLTIVLAILVIAAEIFMPQLVGVLAPGFAGTPDRFAMAVFLARITMPYLPFISLVALWVAIANANHRYGFGAAMPVMMNLFLILGACAVPFSAHHAAFNMATPVALAVLAGGICQLAAMYYLLRSVDSLPPLIWPRISAAGRTMWRKFVPAALGAAGMQLNTLVDLILASMLQVGAISWLYFADRVAQLPLGIVGIALGTALLPSLSRAEADGDYAAIPKALSTAIRLGGFFVIPAVAALVILSSPIITGLFGYGKFSTTDGAMASAALVAYALGLPGFVLIKILQTAFYANGRPVLVLRISLTMVAINIAGSLLLMGPFGHVGLAAATSISATVAAGLMLVFLGLEKRLTLDPVLPLCKMGLAAALMVTGLVIADSQLPDIMAAGRLAILVGIGGMLYFVAAGLLKVIPEGIFRR